MAKGQWREPSTLFDTEKRFFSGGVVLGTPCSKREKDVLRKILGSFWLERERGQVGRLECGEMLVTATFTDTRDWVR